MFINDIFKKQQISEANVKKPQPYNEPGWTKKLSTKELDAIAGSKDFDRPSKDKKDKQKKQDIKEAGPFSYGAKKPRRGSVADLAAKKRQEQEKGKQPSEPRDHQVGVARVVKELDFRGVSAGDQAAYDKYAEIRVKGDILDREASETPSPVSFAGSTQSGLNQDTRTNTGPNTKVYQSQLSKDLIAGMTTGKAAQNPEMEKRYMMNKLAVRPTKTNAEIAAQLESQGVAEGSLNEGVMDQLKRIYMMLVSDMPMGTPESEFLGHWQRIIRDDLGKNIDIDTLAKLRDNFVNRYKTMGRRGDVGDWHREMGMNEMDKSAPQPGRDGHVSHKTYGSRDTEGERGTQHTVKPQKAKDAAKDAEKILNKIKIKEGKDDLSQYSTERLQAYVKKVSGGGVPAFGSGAKLKRVQQELKRREQGVAEGDVIKGPWSGMNKPEPGERYVIIRTKPDGTRDFAAGHFDSWQKAKQELQKFLDHELHTELGHQFEIVKKKGVAEGSRKAWLKHNDLVDLEKPLKGLEDEFNSFLRTHDPDERAKYQSSVKQRIKTKPMAGPKGVLPEQGVAEDLDNSKITVNKIDAYDDPSIEEWHVYRGKKMIGYIIKNQPDTAEGLYIASGYGPGRGFTEEFTSLKPAVKFIASLDNQGVAEARKPDYNFDIEDIKKLEQVRDLETLKTLALQLISKPSAKPMKPEKVEWFRSALERMDSPLKIIKLMYDLLLSGEGHSVIGSRKSMNPNTYRQRFGEDKITNEDIEKYLEEIQRAGYEVISESQQMCPECGGPAFADQLLAEKQDACYSKVKSRYKVWPSAYASGALVRCRKVGAKNWGNKSKK